MALAALATTLLATILVVSGSLAFVRLEMPLPGDASADRPRAAPAPRPEHGRTDRGDRAPSAGSERGASARRPRRRASSPRPPEAKVVWRASRALGTPNAGALVAGVKLPREGRHFFTWDPEQRTVRSPRWRRYATARLIRTILRVVADFARAHPKAPRVMVGDLSRPRGGDFGAAHSPRLLHVSHQNGLDADVYYPRRDRRETAPVRVVDIDLRLAQDLVDRFVAAGARFVFVGPNTPLTGPAGVVQVAARHDNHLHVRLPAA